MSKKRIIQLDPTYTGPFASWLLRVADRDNRSEMLRRFEAILDQVGSHLNIEGSNWGIDDARTLGRFCEEGVLGYCGDTLKLVFSLPVRNREDAIGIALTNATMQLVCEGHIRETWELRTLGPIYDFVRRMETKNWEEVPPLAKSSDDLRGRPMRREPWMPCWHWKWGVPRRHWLRFLQVVLPVKAKERLIRELYDGPPNPLAIFYVTRATTGDHKGRYGLFDPNEQDSRRLAEYAKGVLTDWMDKTWGKSDAPLFPNCLAMLNQGIATKRAIGDDRLLREAIMAMAGKKGRQNRQAVFRLSERYSGREGYWTPMMVGSVFSQLKSQVEHKDECWEHLFAHTQVLLEAYWFYRKREHLVEQPWEELRVLSEKENFDILVDVMRRVERNSIDYWFSELRGAAPLLVMLGVPGR